MPPPASRLRQLAQLSAKLFGNIWNPTNARTGNKILQERLKGPTFVDYYPQKSISFRTVSKNFPELGLIDLEEKARLDEIGRRKRRGKGAPKKGQGKRAQNKKR